MRGMGADTDHNLPACASGDRPETKNRFTSFNRCAFLRRAIGWQLD